MNYPNPTPLEVGMIGTVGRSYRVAGRVVLSMEEGAETYYWNEFNLMDSLGNSATLVFEETEYGGQWRLFTLFDPARPLTAAEAAAKRVGHTVDLDGTNAPITLVDESRVRHIEGEAPEGVEVGDVARYLNAETSAKIWVVSWTGDEVEFYRGINVPAAQVAKAFGFTAASRVTPTFHGGHGGVSKTFAGPLVKIAVAVLVAVLGLTGFMSCRHRDALGGIKRSKMLPPPLAVGSRGSLRDTAYRVRSHAVVRIAEVGTVYDRHEYLLCDPDERTAWLVYPGEPGVASMYLLTPFQPEPALTPLQAGAKGIGAQVGAEGRVIGLFQSTVQSVAGEGPAFRVGAVAFHFKARVGTEQWFARWTETNLDCFRATPLAVSEVKQAFSSGSKGPGE